jgi:hypothetical protein
MAVCYIPYMRYNAYLRHCYVVSQCQYIDLKIAFYHRFDFHLLQCLTENVPMFNTTGITQVQA